MFSRIGSYGRDAISKGINSQSPINQNSLDKGNS